MKINGTDLELVDEFDFLGPTINKNMTCNPHIKISNKLFRVVGIMDRIKHALPKAVVRVKFLETHFFHRQK